MQVKFDMIGIFVQDLSKMVGFYRDVIGLESEWDEKSPYAEFQHEGIRFSMFSRKELPTLLGRTPSYPEGINGSFELSLKVGAPAQVDIVYARMLEGGAQPIYAARDEPWHMRSAMIADPEGNLIEIASDFWE